MFGVWNAQRLLELVLEGDTYLSVYAAFPGPNGEGELASRVLVGWVPPANAATTNSTSPMIGPLPEGPVSHIGLWDAGVGGNFLYGGGLSVARFAQAGDSISFDVGALTLQHLRIAA